jgi:hypothetical protein
MLNERGGLKQRDQDRGSAMNEHRSRYDTDKTAPRPGSAPEDIERFLGWAGYIAASVHEIGRAQVLRDLLRTFLDAATYDSSSTADERAQFKSLLAEAEDHLVDVMLDRAPSDWAPFTD